MLLVCQEWGSTARFSSHGRQTDRQTTRVTERLTDRQTNRQIDRQTDRLTDRQTDGSVRPGQVLNTMLVLKK